ncbi:MAG: hypothetical protein M3O15_04865, partial [Acidobacteriota bacterium]|nr:hypothetical protein [Acidobacteriota bacterium]
RLLLAVEPGWHVQANPATEAFLLPTTVAALEAELRGLRYPPGEELQPGFSERPLAVYRGEVELTGELRAEPGRGRLLLTCQPCDDGKCLPEVTQEIPIGQEE